MITNKQKEWLMKHHGDTKRPDYKIYMNRIQKQIDGNFDRGVWLAQTFPDVFLNQVKGVTSVDVPKHMRWQKLLMMVSMLRSEDYDVYAERK